MSVDGATSRRTWMDTRFVRAALAGLTALALAGLAGCGGSDNTAGSSSNTSSSAGTTGGITVFAAASLTESFTKIGKDFEAANPGMTVTFNFGGSSALATQINEGARRTCSPRPRRRTCRRSPTPATARAHPPHS
jgi:ABC-type molybdate transport system substrate-binding protein